MMQISCDDEKNENSNPKIWWRDPPTKQLSNVYHRRQYYKSSIEESICQTIIAICYIIIVDDIIFFYPEYTRCDIRGFSTNHWPSDDDHNSTSATVQSTSSLHIPPHAAHKVCTAMDAVSLISRGGTLA